jgi:hypothetical protein
VAQALSPAFRNMRIPAGLLLAVTSAFSQSTTPHPFSVTEVSRQFDAAGKLDSESRFLFATNRAGSIVKWMGGAPR